MSSRFGKVRDYAFADRALALRTRAGLTQRDLAVLLGVSDQSIHAWEAGLSYPAAARLRQLIAVYLERGALATGREEEEAAALWAIARMKAPRRQAPFDPAWFAALPRAPAPVAVECPPTNISSARTAFVGRAADLATLTRELDPTGTGTRLLTVSGVAGCGKTRLALTAAGMLRDRYGDGVWLVELSPLPASASADPGPVAAAALAALGVPEQPGQTPSDTLVAHARARRLLLVLDNCEHMAAACAALATRLLRACPALRILATSQRPLGSADETVQPLAPFAAPPPMAGPPTSAALEVLGRSDAVRLFVERARAVRPGFALDARNAAAVAAICRRLDGLPLAIELAAARLHVLPLEEILARLDDRFRLLRCGARDTTDRHRALEATLDWSYGLLDPAGRALLRRLSVFAGGWEVAAAEAVCAGGEVAAAAVLELLDELLDRSLVYVRDADGAPRYGMLETVRQYGAQQLERAGETEALRDRHLAWCMALAEQASSALLGSEQVAWLAWLDREHDNLRAALRWALDHGRGASGLRVAAGLWQYWRNRGYLSEGRRWLTTALELAPEGADTADAASLTVQANALEGAAWLAEDEHDFAAASALFARSAARRQRAGQDDRITGLLIIAAMEARASGDYARATAQLEESLTRHRILGNHDTIMSGGLGLSLTRLALVLGEQGHYTRARALYEECLALHRELGDREGVASALLGLSDVARDLGETAQVHAYGQQCLAIFQEYGLKWAIGFSLNNLALAAYLDRDLAEAARYAEESVALFRGLQAKPSLAEALITLGRIRVAHGAATGGRADLAEALRLAWVDGPRLFVAAALEDLGVLAAREGHARRAVELLGAAAGLRQVMGTPARPSDRPVIDDALAAARAALGVAASTAAWATGQTLRMERIVTCAAGAEDRQAVRPARDTPSAL